MSFQSDRSRRLLSSKVPGSCLDLGLAARRLIHTADMSTFDDISPRRGWLTASNTNHTAVTHVISSAKDVGATSMDLCDIDDHTAKEEGEKHENRNGSYSSLTPHSYPRSN